MPRTTRPWCTRPGPLAAAGQNARSAFCLSSGWDSEVLGQPGLRAKPEEREGGREGPKGIGPPRLQPFPLQLCRLRVPSTASRI